MLHDYWYLGRRDLKALFVDSWTDSVGREFVFAVGHWELYISIPCRALGKARG